MAITLYLVPNESFTYRPGFGDCSIRQSVFEGWPALEIRLSHATADFYQAGKAAIESAIGHDHTALKARTLLAVHDEHGTQLVRNRVFCSGCGGFTNGYASMRPQPVSVGRFSGRLVERYHCRHCGNTWECPGN